MKPNIVNSGAKFRETYTPPPEENAVYGSEAAALFLNKLKPQSFILDIGGGEDGNGFGELCRNLGHSYRTFDWCNGDDWEHPHLLNSMMGKYDGVYMCHSLEHMLNPNAALQKIHRVLKVGGVLAVTVPPLKHKIVGGHLSLWNAGLLLYHLVMAGFDCRDAHVKTYGYNISVVVKHKPFDLPDLKRDSGDIVTLAEYFPMPVSQGFDGQFDAVNWP